MIHHFPCKRLIAHLLLLGQLVSSCGTPPALRMGPEKPNAAVPIQCLALQVYPPPEPAPPASQHAPGSLPYTRTSAVSKPISCTPPNLHALLADKFGPWETRVPLGTNPFHAGPWWSNASPIPMLTTKEGHALELMLQTGGYRARVTDPRFPGIPAKLLPVHFAPGYSPTRLAQLPTPPIQCMRTSDGQEIVYIGPAGLLGGSLLNWFGYKSCTKSWCFAKVYVCSCGFRCPDKYCSIHCENHQSSHRCVRCYGQCPILHSCSTCSSSKYCSMCCGCAERAEAARQRETQLRREAEAARSHAAHRAQLQAQWDYQCQRQEQQRAQERAAQEAAQRRQREAEAERQRQQQLRAAQEAAQRRQREAEAERQRQQQLRAELQRQRREQEHQQVLQKARQVLAQTELDPAEDATCRLASQPAPVRAALSTHNESTHVLHHTASDLLWSDPAQCDSDSSSDEAPPFQRPTCSVTPLDTLGSTRTHTATKSSVPPLASLAPQPSSEPLPRNRATIELHTGPKTAFPEGSGNPIFSLKSNSKKIISSHTGTTLPPLHASAKTHAYQPIPLRRPEPALAALKLPLSPPDEPIDPSVAIPPAQATAQPPVALEGIEGVAALEAEACEAEAEAEALEAQKTPPSGAGLEASQDPFAPTPNPTPEDDPWTYELLLQALLDTPTPDPFLLDDFRSKWHDLQAGHSLGEQVEILRVLKDQKYGHGLSLRRINALLDQLRESGSTGCALLCGTDGPRALQAHWLTRQTSRLDWPQADRERLLQALIPLDWSPYGIRSLVDALEGEAPCKTLEAFLAFVHAEDLPESLVLPTLEQPPFPNQTKAAHWTHVLAHRHLLHTLETRAPEAVKVLDQPLYELLRSCPYRLIQDALETHFEAIVGCPDAFAAVLQQLHTYQLTPAACATALTHLNDTAPASWEAALDQHIVSELFQESRMLAPSELLDHIAQTSPEVSPGLPAAYAALCSAFEAPAASLQSVEDAALKKLASKPISKWTQTDIPAWATHAKAVAPAQSECLAVLQQAAHLHHGFLPRTTQLLALLALLHSSPGKGRLAQINTGEGKSLIVALLAAYHALRGTTVDVVTTSTELSLPEVEKQRPFFALFGLTVGENSCLETKKAAYACPIVYGTTSDFQGDLLRSEFLGQSLRGNRGFGVVLVDEVDSMLFDNRTQSVRLSEATPGMYHLELPLAAIWEHIHRLTRHLVEFEGTTYFIPEDFTAKGKHIRLSNGGFWRDCAHPIADKRRFLTEKTQDYLTALLRDLTPAEAEEYALFQALNGTLATLRNKAQMASQQQAEANQALTARKEQAVVDQHTSWWMFPGYKAKIQQKVRQLPEFQNLVETLDSRTSKMDRLEDRIAQCQSKTARHAQAIEDVQAQLNALPWNQRHPILEIPAHLRALARASSPTGSKTPSTLPLRATKKRTTTYGTDASFPFTTTKPASYKPTWSGATD